MVNSKDKGKRWERKFARLLTEATGGKWHRTAGSGAMATAQGVQDNRYRGDLFCEDERYEDVVVEVKSYKSNIRLEDIYNDNSSFWKWIRQCERESDGNPWILLFHTNNGMSFCVFPEHDDNSYPYISKFNCIFRKDSPSMMVWYVDDGDNFSRYCIERVIDD